MLLRAISDGLKPATDEPIGGVGDGHMPVRTHLAIGLLDELIDALTDFWITAMRAPLLHRQER